MMTAMNLAGLVDPAAVAAAVALGPTPLREAAASARGAGVRAATDRPSQRRHVEDHPGTSAARVAGAFEVRAKGGTPSVGGFASVTEKGYEMWDMFGPYTEVVALTAFDATLATDPLVEFTINHGAGGGLPMAHTRNATLVLAAVHDGDPTGLRFDATVDASRHDVADMLKAMERGDLAEASFKFRIIRGLWSPDWMQYRIEEIDIDRGDVSAVNFGANPFASSGIKHAADTPAATATPVAFAAEDTARRVLIADADVRRRTA